MLSEVINSNFLVNDCMSNFWILLQGFYCFCSYLKPVIFQWQALELRNKELRQNEEKVKAANSELCTKMREMIQELDQEKQEATER